MRTRTPGDYEVGFGKPPKEHRFAKGKSGNPTGKKRRRKPDNERSVASHVCSLFAEEVTITQNGKIEKLPMTAVLARKLLQRAMAGDVRMIKLLLDLQGQGKKEANSRIDELDLDALAKDPFAAQQAYARFIKGA